MSEYPDPSFHRKMQWIGILIFVLFALISGSVYIRATATNQERSDTKKTFKAVICSIEEAGLKQSKSLDQAQEIATFYNNLLTHVVGTTPCRK